MTRIDTDANTGAELAPEDQPPPAAQRPWLGLSARQLFWLRIGALTLWALAVAFGVWHEGITYDRNVLLLCICTGLMAASIGHRNVLLVLRDWLPFALILLLYDYSRGAALLFGRPTQWHLQISFDKALFLGHEPTVWLQSHLKEAYPPWWETVVSLVYVSFFFAPYVVAGILYVRNRVEWKKFVLRFVAVSFIGLIGFVVYPAAPPWAASLCHSADVVGGPSDPPCMSEAPGQVTDGGMLGQVVLHHAHAAPWVERISTRGWDRLGVPKAGAIISEGQATSNEVAAIPSLHAAISSLISVFLWTRVRKRWRPLLAAYALTMAFSLVYAAEHYVFDILLGWALTAAVSYAFHRWEQRAHPVAAPEADERATPVAATDTLKGSSATAS